MVYDVTDAYAWSEWIRNYDAAGNLTSQNYVNNDVAPTGVNDTAATHEDNTAAITGNVLSNDGGSNLVVDKVENLSFSGSTPRVVAGVYGTLTISANGAWSYVVDTTKPAFQTLGNGQSVTEDFDYIVKNNFGSAAAKIVITIEGRNEPS
ncbi:MAG: VCBS domain-containing protein, partial [Nitratireductor sp.]|nr:VCBS domain-containing protein [Nitratireductor sp.]